MVNLVHSLVITHTASPTSITTVSIIKSGSDAVIIAHFKLKKG